MKKLWLAINCATPPEDAEFHVTCMFRGEAFDFTPDEVEVHVTDPPHGLNALASVVHEANEKWWIDVRDGVTPLIRNKGELLALIHSEISEALEGERKNLMDDKLPHRKMAEVELADALIRILDYSAGFGYDIEGAFREKMAYNATREDHTHEARKIAGGKQF
jgi:NTP pyrophosphatase (non-canonical NTP hydrolase)